MKRILVFGSWAIACVFAPSVWAAPNVVVSIKPIGSLVEGVMAGVGTPKVIVGGNQSIHTFSMKPSDARALNDANLIFWIGEGLEEFLEKPIRSLSSGATVVEMMDAPGLSVLKGREGGVWEGHLHEPKDKQDNDHKHDHKHDHDHDHDVDGHIWLDPDNAKSIVKMAEVALTEVDPTNAATYAANAKAVAARIDALDQELRSSLAAVKDRPFVVFHDGYQYLEAHYGLNAIGSITVSQDRMPGAKRIGEIKSKVKSLKAACVFAEPQFEPKLVQTLIEGTDAKTGVLDPEASSLPPGPNLYFDLMRGLASSLTGCLKSS